VRGCLRAIIARSRPFRLVHLHNRAARVREHDAGENKGAKRCSVEKIVPARFFSENAIFPANGHGHCYTSHVVNGASDVQEMQIANLTLIIARRILTRTSIACIHARENNLTTFSLKR